MKRLDLITFIIIYAIGFGIVLGYGLAHLPVNDGVKEYNEVLANIKEGWVYRLTLVNSCLVTTWLPAILHKITHIDSLFLFRLIPALFYPLMPAFTYLIARRYINYKYAIIATSLVLLNSHIAYFPDMNRVGVAIGFMAGMVWALLEKKIIWAVIFSILLVFSHYGTTLVAIGIVSFVLIGYLVWNYKLLYRYLIILGILLGLTIVWHFNIAGYSGAIMGQTLLQTEQVGQILPVNADIFDISTREPAVQSALGINSTMPIPQIIEIISNWIIVFIVSIGMYYIMRKKEMDFEYKLTSSGFYCLIILTIAIPWLSTYYGGMRIYFNSTMVLATGFVLGGEKIAQIIHINPILFIGVVLILYGLGTTGIIYLPFGMEKTFPVMLEFSR